MLAPELAPIVHAPIFKKGNRVLAENYRPASLTCITCKLFEHIVCRHIPDHVHLVQILKFASLQMIVYFIEKLKNNQDQIDMQRDLDALMDWGSTWGMKFNAKKCNIMRVSRSRKPLQHFYSLGSEILQEVSDAKYLGIQIDNKLDWNKYILGTLIGRVLIAARRTWR